MKISVSLLIVLTLTIVGCTRISGDDQAGQGGKQAAYQEQARTDYQAWRRSEQAVYRTVIAERRGESLGIVHP